MIDLATAGSSVLFLDVVAGTYPLSAVPEGRGQRRVRLNVARWIVKGGRGVATIAGDQRARERSKCEQRGAKPLPANYRADRLLDSWENEERMISALD
jgi:hypothetical protein